MEISTELGGHAHHDFDVCACARKHARMLACMHTIFWHAWAQISESWVESARSKYLWNQENMPELSEHII